MMTSSNFLITTLTNQYLLEMVEDGNVYADKSHPDIIRFNINTIHNIQKYLDERRLTNNTEPCFVVTKAGAYLQIYNLEEIRIMDTYIQY